MSENSTGYITVGQVLGSHGQNGELRVKVLTEFPERFQKGARIYIKHSVHTIESSSFTRDTALIKINGVDTRQNADSFRGESVEVPECERKELPAGRYYYLDVIGLHVWTSTGVFVGEITDILKTGCNDIYVVKDGAKEALIPAVKDIVKAIDIPNKRMTIEAIEGLLGKSNPVD